MKTQTLCPRARSRSNTCGGAGASRSIRASCGRGRSAVTSARQCGDRRVARRSVARVARHVFARSRPAADYVDRRRGLTGRQRRAPVLPRRNRQAARGWNAFFDDPDEPSRRHAARAGHVHAARRESAQHRRARRARVRRHAHGQLRGRARRTRSIPEAG